MNSYLGETSLKELWSRCKDVFSLKSHDHNYAGSSSVGGVANSAVKLQTARNINGIPFDGTQNITTANWGSSRNIKIGNTSKVLNGSSDVAWSLSEIGAAPIAKLSTVDTNSQLAYARCGTMNGPIKYDDSILRYNTFMGTLYVEGTDGSYYWDNLINIRHRDGSGDGGNYGLQIVSEFGTESSLKFRHQNTNTWGKWIEILDSNNLSEYTIPLSGGELSGPLSSSLTSVTHLNGNNGRAIISSTAAAGSYTMLAKMNSSNGYFTHGVYQDGYMLYYTLKTPVDAGTNGVTKAAKLLDEFGNTGFPGEVTASSFVGNASTSSTLKTARTINGTPFNGSSNITTETWGSSRTLTIGKTGKVINGSNNVTWSLEDIGALPISGGAMTGVLQLRAGFSDVTDTPQVQIQGIMGNNDKWAISAGAVGNDIGWMEISTGDNGEEPIYVRQYSNSTVRNSIILMNSTGDQRFNKVTATRGFHGPLYGNSDTTTKLQTSRSISLTGAVTGSVNFDGSGNVSMSTTEGDVSFKKMGIVTESVNWDSLMEPGCYKIQMPAWGDASVNHSPNAHTPSPYHYGLLLVFKSAVALENRTVQIYFPHSDGLTLNGGIFTRMFNSLSWNSWKPIFKGVSKDYIGLGNVANEKQYSASNLQPTVAKLTTPRTINGTSFDGSSNITTANWGTSRTLTIGNTGKNVNGSSNISWSLSEIGAFPSSGGILSGPLTMTDNIHLNGKYIRFKNGSSAYLGSNGYTDSIFMGGLTDYVMYTESADPLSPWFGATWTSNGVGRVNLGAPAYRWKSIYASSATIVTSDKRHKNSISEFDTSTIKKFMMGLRPVSFKMNDGDSGRTHFGLIAQDVEALLSDIGMSTTDFAGFIKSKLQKDVMSDNKPQDEFMYGLRYEEFISPLIRFVQLQQKEIEKLTSLVNNLID